MTDRPFRFRYSAQYDVGEEEERAAAERLGIPWPFPTGALSSAEKNRRYRARKRGELPPFLRVLPDLGSNAKRIGDCLIWQRARTNRGYGHVRRGRRWEYAHRLALEEKLGRPLRPGMRACHTCDMPPCIRPDHLFEGSAGDNVRDMYAKGRWSRAA